MSSTQQIPLPATPKLAFAELHQPEEIKDFTTEIYGRDLGAQSGMSTVPATTQFNVAAPVFVPSSAAVPSNAPASSPTTQAPTSLSHAQLNRQQHSGRGTLRAKSPTTLRADVFFRSDEFRAICALALQHAVLPAFTKPPTNYMVGITPLHIQHASLATIFSTLFCDLATRRANSAIGASDLKEAAVKHVSAIFASLAAPHLPSSCLCAVSKDPATLPVLAAAALQKAVSYPSNPPPNNWQAERAHHQRRRLQQKPLHPYYDGIMQRLRWAMLKLIWEERREWFAWRVYGPGVQVEEEELRQQLERGIGGAQEFVLRELRREWIATLGPGKEM